MFESRVGMLVAGVVIGAAHLGVQPAVAQFPSEATRMVDVLGLPTRILELGLDARMAGQPVLVLQSGGQTPLEGWGDWPLLIARMAPVIAFDRPGIG